MKRTLLCFLVALLISPACDMLNQLATTTVTQAPLSLDEVIKGLKTALVVGTDSSTTRLHLVDGYFRDAAVKILLPPEAKDIVENADKPIFSAIGLKKMIDQVILSMNRAAEDAAADAGPIFRQAITGLSFSDAWAILKGTNPAAPGSAGTFDSLAATHYLHSVTYQSLYNAFSPRMNQSLDKKLVAGLSANAAWKDMTGAYNKVAGSVAGKLAGLKTVNTDLAGYATGKALDGLFLKAGEQERMIRHNPFAWAASSVGDILKRVFGK